MPTFPNSNVADHRAGNLVVTGFMGTGKTLLGRLLAEQLGYSFLDTDALIETEQGTPISNIFQEQGEVYFRRLEQETLARLTQRDCTVIATGGGTACSAAGLNLLQRLGPIICLFSDPETIHARTAQQCHRPLLEGYSDRLQRIRQLLARRMPFYRQADLMVDVSRRTPREAVALICSRLASL